MQSTTERNRTGLAALAELDPRTPLSAPELAAALGIHVKTLYRAVQRGALPPSFRTIRGRHWTAGAVIEHMAMLQAQAVVGAVR